MRKKCVRWTKSVRIALIATVAIISALAVNPAAQTNDPSAQPKLAFSDISYLGGFRLPATSVNGDSFEFGGRQLAFNPASNSLIVGSRAGRLAEVTIPNPVNSSNPAALPFASYLQPFSDPTEGHLSEITGEGVRLDSIMVFGNRLYGTASVYYDANATQSVSHYSRSLQLNEPSFSGWSSVWAADKTGFVSGSMSVVPTEWRGTLGGPAATGQCCIPIVMRTSWGPSAFAFDPTQIGQGLVPASPLLYYTGTHPTLGQWDDANPTYGATIQMGGLAMIAGTRTALYIGRIGTGPNCYGNGTADPALVGTVAPDGAHYCYDPTSNVKGSHAYPYRYQIWAYDLNDFAAVKAGTKQPWDVTPYGVWPFDFPTAEESVTIGGVGYDAATQRVYVSQMLADRDGYAMRPVIHVLQINATPGSQDPSDAQPLPTSPDPTSPAPTAPSTSSVVSAITLAVNRTAPQVTGTAITFSAFATGGVSPQEYKWLLDDGSGMKAVTGWSVIDTFTWTPATANDKYRVGVWARSSGNSRDEAEASATTAFAITQPVSAPVTSVAISADKTAPQLAGTTVTFTATPSAGSGQVEYKWMIYDGSPTWLQPTGWTTSNTFRWTPTVARAEYEIRVWARTSGTTADEPQADVRMSFPITAPAPVRLSSVSMTADKSAPQVAGTPITFQAVAVGGAAQYSFLLYDGSPTWQFLTGWTTQSSFTWTPTAANANYVMRVLVRSATSTSDEWEADTRIDFPITSAPVLNDIRIDSISTVPVIEPAKPISSVALATDKASPQAPGTTIVTTATVTGGSTTLQYQWLIHDGYEWKSVTGWTSSKTFSWTPTAANPSHFIGVWVRNAANTDGGAEVTASLPFSIQ